MTTVLVTGANGHLGCEVTRAVIANGDDVVGFVRPGSDRRGLEGLDIELREGDLLDPDSVSRAMDGVHLVMHVAGVNRAYAVDDREIFDPIFIGTRNVLAAARARGVDRLVYTSSSSTIGFSPDPRRPFDESHTFVGRPRSPLYRGKLEAERLLLETKPGSSPEVVILNPIGILGPHDYRLTPTTRAVLGLLHGYPCFMHMCLTDVRDVARAHVLASQRGRAGQRYLITGDNLAPRQVADLVDKIAGRRPSTIKPPAFVLRFLVRQMERKAAKGQDDPPASSAMMADAAGGFAVYDSSRSRQDLGAEYRPTEQTLRDTFRWALHMNALKPKAAARVRASLGPAAAPDPSWD